jgi:hypothetical protein
LINNEIKQKIKELSQTGKKAKEIAAELKISVGSVYKYLHGGSAPIPPAPAPPTPPAEPPQEIKETLNDLKASGASKKPLPKSEVSPPTKKPRANLLIWAALLVALVLGFSVASLRNEDIRNLLRMRLTPLVERVKKLTQTST